MWALRYTTTHRHTHKPSDGGSPLGANVRNDVPTFYASWHSRWCDVIRVSSVRLWWLIVSAHSIHTHVFYVSAVINVYFIHTHTHRPGTYSRCFCSIILTAPNKTARVRVRAETNTRMVDCITTREENAVCTHKALHICMGPLMRLCHTHRQTQTRFVRNAIYLHKVTYVGDTREFGA